MLPQPKPGIMDISPYVGGKSAAAPGMKPMKLSSNESALGPSPKAVEAYMAEAPRLRRYPDGHAQALREAIAEVHKVPLERVVCGAGSDELIGLLVHAYAGPGDEVLYSEHGFLMYKIYALGAGAMPVAAPEKNLTTDVDALLAAVTPRTKIVFLANPNNPTGTYINAHELARLRAGLPEHVILAIDAAYCEYATEADYSLGRDLVDTSENTVILRTFSKIYGLASLRVGWGYFPKSIADVLNRLRGPFNLSAAAIAAAAAGTRDIAHVKAAVEHNTKWRPWLENQLSALGLAIPPSAGNFLLAEFASAKEASAANEFLLSRGIIVREVGAYNLSQCLRITVGTEAEMRALVDALKAHLLPKS